MEREKEYTFTCTFCDNSFTILTTSSDSIMCCPFCESALDDDDDSDEDDDWEEDE